MSECTSKIPRSRTFYKRCWGKRSGIKESEDPYWRDKWHLGIFQDDTVIKREKLIKTSESLDSDFVSLVKEAEFEKETTVVLHLNSKANSLKRKSEELKGDANKLDETIKLLNAKKKKLQ